MEYVGRYTHRVAISNNRILDIEDGKVRFQWKDYRRGGQQKPMTLDADEFIRRFLIHVLPSGFQRIRYYGLLGNRYRRTSSPVVANFSACRSWSPWTDKADKDYRDTYEELTGISLLPVPCLPPRPYGAVARSSRSHSVPLIIDTS